MNMLDTQSEILAKGLEQRARVLLESAAQGGKSYLPARNLLELSLLPNQASAVAEGTISSTEPMIVTYTDKEGLYGGAAIKGGALSPDTDGNAAYYDKYLAVSEILYDKKLKPTEASADLLKRIEKYSK